MAFHAWLTFVLAAAVLLAIPGPTVLMVIGQSLGAGRRTRCHRSRAWRPETSLP